MGYYSDIGLAMYKKDFEEMLNHFKKENNDAYNLWTHADDYQFFENRYHPSNPVVLVKIYTTKWYSEFPDVVATQDYLCSCGENDIEYQFIRLGEDLDDNEELYHGDLWEYCGIQRSIESDIAPKETGSYTQLFKQADSIDISEII